ncbi:MAG: hypothetical protein VW862_03775 [Euryarchaeota archaeon]
MEGISGSFPSLADPMTVFGMFFGAGRAISISLPIAADNLDFDEVILES